MPPRRRTRDSVGGKVEAGCAKCCAYCRLSPLGSAVCYSAVILTVVTFILYLFGAGLSSAAEPPTDKPKPNGLCSTNITVVIGSVSDLYINYLKITGVIVFLLVIAVMMSCCICCGFFCNLPKAAKIVAAIAIIPASLLIGLYIGWLAFGTYLIAVMDEDRRKMLICRNIITYMILLYFYLLCLIGFAIIIAIWKIHGYYKDRKGGRSSSSSTRSRAQPSGPPRTPGIGATTKLLSVI